MFHRIIVKVEPTSLKYMGLRQLISQTHLLSAPLVAEQVAPKSHWVGPHGIGEGYL